MPFPPKRKTALSSLLAAGFGLPPQDVKARTRVIAEGGLAPMGHAPFLPEHAINMLLGMLAPTHINGAKFVRDYAAFPSIGVSPSGGDREAGDAAMRLFPKLLTGTTLSDALLDVLRGLGAEVPEFDVVEVAATWPPHEAFLLRVRPSAMLTVDIEFAAQTGVARAFQPRPSQRLKHTVSFDGAVLNDVAEFMTTLGDERAGDDDEDDED